MTVELIRVQDPQTWVEWAWKGAWEQAKERPYLALIAAAPAAIVAAPFIALSAVSERIWGPSETPAVTIYPIAEAKKIIDVRGQSLSPGTIYLRLSRESEKDVIAPASEFHSIVLGQKIAEIIHYMRSETRLSSISILVKSLDKKYVFVKGHLKELSGDLRTETQAEKEGRIHSTYGDPSRLVHQPHYVWLQDLPEVVAATKNAERGTLSFSQRTNMSFGMSGEVAKFANFEAGWLSSFAIEIEASFA